MNAAPAQPLTPPPDAFAVVYDRLYPPIFGYVCRRVADYDLACDIVSETFLKVWLRWHSFEGRGGVPIDAWVYRIATNEINQYYRKKQYAPESLRQLIDFNGFDPIAPESLESERTVAERQMREHADFMRIQQLLPTLPVDYQTVLALRYFEQQPLQTIADIMDRPLGTVKSLLSRGIGKLKQLLQTT